MDWEYDFDISLWDGWYLAFDFGILIPGVTPNRWFHVGTREKHFDRWCLSHLIWHVCLKWVWWDFSITKNHKR